MKVTYFLTRENVCDTMKVTAESTSASGIQNVMSPVDTCGDGPDHCQKIDSTRLHPWIGIFLCLLIFMVTTCSDRMPTQADFIDWLSEKYREETGLAADEVMIYRWEKTAKEIIRLAPEVDGLRVEAAIFSTAGDDVFPADDDQVIVHYVFCRYFAISDEWYLHASSWGGGFWKQEPKEWSHLIRKCHHRVQQIQDERNKARDEE